MAANLTRYSYWQLRDFVRERGVALIITSTLLGLAVIGPMTSMLGANIDEASARRILTAAMPQVVVIAAVIALNGLVSTDRKLGYYRFLFSKPVSIPAYYAQYFAVSFAGFLAVFGLLLGVFAIMVRPVNPIGPLVFCSLVYLSLGGIAFLISSVFNYDWPVLAGVLLGSAMINGFWADRGGWRMIIRDILPPVHKLSPSMTDIMSLGSVNTKAVLWLLGYSAVCFVAGLFVLWRRPIG
ncbi:MAG TPA: hypothetical protein VGJ64_01395 [Gemmatimonadaceae bacterium]|jgi:hypothetical protein